MVRFGVQTGEKTRQPNDEHIRAGEYSRFELEPPFKPQLSSETDTSFFDPEFTLEPASLSPPPSPAAAEEGEGDKDDFDAVWGDLVSLAESVFSQFSYLGSSHSSGLQRSISSASSASVAVESNA